MVPDLEKTGYGYAEQQEQKKVYSDVDSQDAYVEEYTPEEQRKIIHRIDRRLVTTVGLMYCISLMDRTNLSAAAIAGMTVELRLNVVNPPRYLPLSSSSPTSSFSPHQPFFARRSDRASTYQPSPSSEELS